MVARQMGQRSLGARLSFCIDYIFIRVGNINYKAYRNIVRLAILYLASTFGEDIKTCI
jgi:hypothetical protein